MAVLNPLPLNLHFASRVSPAKGPRSNDAMMNRRRCVLEWTSVCPFQRLCANKSKRHVRIIPNTWWNLDKFRIIPFISQRIITKRRGEVKTRSPCCAMRLPLLHRWCLVLVVRRGLRKWVLRNGGLARSRLDKWRLEVLTDRSNMFGWNNHLLSQCHLSFWGQVESLIQVTGPRGQRGDRCRVKKDARRATRGGLEWSRATDSGLSKNGDTPIYWYIGDFEVYIILYYIYIYVYTVGIDGIHNYDYCNHVILGIHHIFMHFQTYARPTITTCHCLIGEPCQPLRSHEHSTRFLVSALPLQADSFRAFLNYLQGAEGKVLGQTAEDRLNIRVDPGDFCLRHSTTMRVLMSSRFAAPQSTRSPVGNLCSWWFGP